MRIPTLLLVAAILSSAVLIAGCTRGPGQEPASPPNTPVMAAQTSVSSPGAVTQPSIGRVQTTPDLIAYVDRAADFARENGKEKAIAAFNDPKGPFVSDSLYVFAGDYNGTTLAEPFQPGMAGRNSLSLTDRFGIPFVQNFIETARSGKGYVSYRYPNPARNNAEEPKLSVVEDIDGSYYIGAGIYASSGDIYPSVKLNVSGTTSGVGGLVSYVKEAVDYARANGREKALAVFNNKTGQFNRGELVVMAFDYNGTNLASPPYSPELTKSRINLINYHDPDGIATIRGMRDLAGNGGGFLYTVAKISVNGTDVYVPKIDYAEPVDSEWWLFSGIIDPDYTRLGSGNFTGIPLRNHTRAELYDLVNSVVAYAQMNGKEKTLAAINDSAGRFASGDLFAWAYSTDGTLLADPFWKSGIGQNQMNYTDHNGMKMTKVGIESMRNATGFSHALFPNTAKNGTTDVPKLIYMKPVDDSWFIGSGIYGVEVK